MSKKINTRRRPLRIESLEDRKLMATVTGVVFNDVNGNGAQDVGDAPLAGRTVFMDLNENSTVDTNEPIVITAADGAYLFSIAPVTTSQNFYVGLSLPAPEATGRLQNTNKNYGGFTLPPTVASDPEPAFNFNFGTQFVPYTTFKPAPVQGETLISTNANAISGGSSWTYSYRNIATDDNGNYAAMFISDASTGKVQVKLQVFNADGTKRGAETVLTVNAMGNSQTVTMSRDGSRIAVAWQERDSQGSIAPFVQLFDNNGAKVGSPIQTAAFGKLKSFATPIESLLRGIEMDRTGNFAVLMAVSSVSTGTPNIQVQRYTRAGAVSGKVVGLKLGIANYDIRLSMDASGNFLLTWGDGSSILAQRFSATGTALGSRIVVATDTTLGNLRLRAVAMNSTGRFSVIWQADSYGSNPTIVAQAFDSSGVKIGGLLRNLYPIDGSNDGRRDYATVNSAGDLTFTYVRDASGTFFTETNDRAADVWVRQISASGVLSEAQIVNSRTEGFQSFPSIASTPSGFIVSWLSSLSSGGHGVFTQQFQRPVVTAAVSGLTTSNTTSLSPASVDYLLGASVEDPITKKTRKL